VIINELVASKRDLLEKLIVVLTGKEIPRILWERMVNFRDQEFVVRLRSEPLYSSPHPVSASSTLILS
jgi:hypothetical protein